MRERREDTRRRGYEGGRRGKIRGRGGLKEKERDEGGVTSVPFPSGHRFYRTIFEVQETLDLLHLLILTHNIHMIITITFTTTITTTHICTEDVIYHTALSLKYYHLIEMCTHLILPAA